jgi:hypothetical protein
LLKRFEKLLFKEFGSQRLSEIPKRQIILFHQGVIEETTDTVRRAPRTAASASGEEPTQEGT